MAGDILSVDAFIENNRESFEKLNKLYHYTTLGTLDKILESKALRFNRNDKLNDMLEHSRSFEAGFNYYVTCFTHNEKESIPLWVMYAQKKGVRIGFKSKNLFKNRMYFFYNGEKKYFSYEVRGYDGDTPLFNNVYKSGGSVIEIGKPLATKVIYDDKLIELKHTQKYGGGSIHISTTNVYQMAAVKGTAWEYECESRYFLLTNGTYKFIDSIFVELEDDVLNDLEIVFSPFYSEGDLMIMQEDLWGKYPDIKFNFIKSDLIGKIQ